MKKLLLVVMIIPALIAGALGAACLTVNSTIDEMINLDNEVSTESDVAVKTVSVGNFTKLDIRSIELKYTVGKQSKITIKAPKDVISDVICVVKNGTLKIGLKSNHNFKVYPKIEVQFSAPAVNSIKMSGVCSATVSGIYKGPREVDIELAGANVLTFNNDIETEKLDIDLSGASHVTIPKLTAPDLEIDLSGASAVTINTLKTQTPEIDLSGASNMTIQKLDANDLEIDLSGASHMTVDALKTQKLEAKVSGASELSVTGSAKLTKLEASGASKIKASNLDSGSLIVSKSGISQILTKE